LGDEPGRQYEVNATGADGAVGHATELCRSLILGKRNPSRHLDCRTPLGAVGSGTGKNYADSTGPELLGHRLKEVVDGHVLPAGKHTRHEVQRTVLKHHVCVRRDYVDAI